MKVAHRAHPLVPRIRWPRLSLWQGIALGMTLLVLAPLGVILASLFYPTDDVWRHLADTLLFEIVLNTLWLMLGVGVGTALLGVSLGWISAVYEFPGRRIFEWALVLPLAIPAYVTAFVFIGLLDFAGPLQTLLRSWLGVETVWFPQIRSRGGVMVVMSLALYPYVYLLARNAFLTQGRRSLEAAQSLGHGRWKSFFRTALPMARPWIAIGLMLVLMETAADFGAVSVFNYDTFTTVIYKAWFGMFSISTAAQLSSILILIVFVLVFIEQQSRWRMQYVASGKNILEGDRVMLKGRPAAFAFGWSALVLLVAFIIPVTQLVLWTFEVIRQDLDSRYLAFLIRTLLLGGMAALLTCACAFLLVYAGRLHRHWGTRVMIRISTLGYALPGTVLAVSLFIVVAWLDHQAVRWVENLWGRPVGLLISGTPVVMLMAYLIRFLALAHGSLDSAMHRVTLSVDEAARSLGVSGLKMLRKVHLPILRTGMLTAAILVFVEVMKEMPITLMTRPFGWDTLAVKVYEMTSEGAWERAALPAIALVLAGLVPVALLVRQSRENQHG